ncbi:sporulation related protein [Owenweeksia hongkongensis DSM 17368]|uniref:Sporulation related protein n=1 Tax=Owenweeksia hongkongensis (strain DSM 17368 / CIP 108786 / JCM 12287 / NRRL B-23963 / UST20020801) TaxID=926562 RepID=G8R2C0_OWEHD|nr:SPOR domain-containing protein [Owenweeksia hongkongensis]AEV32910.1 sporulation related protein [Owenweeksia hongkongensis DSM 17368]
MLVKTIATLSLISFCTLSYSQAQDSSKGHLQVVPEKGISELQSKYLEQNKKDGSISGFRVQIYNGNKAETLKKRSEFISAFPKVAIYTLYEAPEYKIQAGDFRTRLEAEKFLSEVQESLGSGLVVKTNIKPPLISER